MGMFGSLATSWRIPINSDVIHSASFRQNFNRARFGTVDRMRIFPTRPIGEAKSWQTARHYKGVTTVQWLIALSYTYAMMPPFINHLILQPSPLMILPTESSDTFEAPCYAVPHLIVFICWSITYIARLWSPLTTVVDLTKFLLGCGDATLALFRLPEPQAGWTVSVLFDAGLPWWRLLSAT